MTVARVIRAELTGSTVCSAGGITVNVNSPVLAMCRALIAAGYNPTSPLHVYRGDTLALTVSSISAGARLAVKTAGNGAPGFVQECDGGGATAPPVRLNGPGGIWRPEPRFSTAGASS